MKFSVGSVKYGYYGCADDILKAYPNITNCTIEEIETRYGLDKQLIVKLNSAEDFLRFVKEVDCEIIIDDPIRSGKPSLLIYDDYME